jgi:DNA invertase Pin-like site-specific DNA recombinase
MTVFGYARVSTNGQTLAQQDAALRAAGVAKTYSEKISGAVTDRPELAKLIKRLQPGDVLMVTRLDRLARSTSSTPSARRERASVPSPTPGPTRRRRTAA